MSVGTRYERVSQELAQTCRQAGRNPEDVTLIAVSKTVGPDEVAEAIAAGAQAFGENRPDELLRKQAAYPQAQWHFIGNVQSRRIKDIVSAATLIHSVCKPDHLPKIDHAAREAGKVQPILLEVNVSGEESKSGLAPDQVLDAALQAAALPNVELRGLMTMAPRGDADVADNTFAGLRALRDQVQEQLDRQAAGVRLSELSMGMSEDWPEAVAEGSTMVRVGRAIFSPEFE